LGLQKGWIEWLADQSHLTKQYLLPGFDTIIGTTEKSSALQGSNALHNQDRAFHDWYRFVLSFPPYLVRHYFEDFSLNSHSVVLDPFCGTGTTLIEAKLNGLQSVGVEAHPFSHFASSVKIDWAIDPLVLEHDADVIAAKVIEELQRHGIEDRVAFGSSQDVTNLIHLDPKRQSLLITDSISPLPLHKSLALLGEIDRHRDARHYNHLRLAFANALVFSTSNLHFGPEVGVGVIKHDAPVVASWLSEIRKIAGDISALPTTTHPSAVAHLGDSRQLDTILLPRSIDAVITSPPYPNEKDYTRTTRLESVVLGFVNSRAELRALKQGLVRSNTRGVYKADDDDSWIAEFPEIQELAHAIEERRKALGKTSGFERLYHRVTKLYFGGMARHLASLRPTLKPGAHLAYVVGDQASYLRVMIRTGQLLARIAERLGYEVIRIDLFRKRFATATRDDLREEVVVLRWKMANSNLLHSHTVTAGNSARPTSPPSAARYRITNTP